MSANIDINISNKFPYDEENEAELPGKDDWTMIAARGVISNLEGRCGVSEALDRVNTETRREIIVQLAAIIRVAHLEDL